MSDVERDLDARMSRRLKAEDRMLARMEKKEIRRERLEEQAVLLVGELVRDGETVYYVNLCDRRGNFTGRTKEFDMQHEAVDFLIRNGYV